MSVEADLGERFVSGNSEFAAALNDLLSVHSILVPPKEVNIMFFMTMTKRVMGKRMVTRLLGILGAVVMTASASAQAEILASCGSLSGHSYFFEDGSIDAEWTEAEIKSTFIFMKSGDALDVIIKGKDLKGENWTRSASDYRAPVFEVNRVGNVCHILVVWADATELYLLDMDRKVFSLVSQKSGLVPGMHAWVGKCE